MTLREIIGQAIGEASLCWEPKPTGVFQSERAVEIADNTLESISEILAIALSYEDPDVFKQLCGINE